MSDTKGTKVCPKHPHERTRRHKAGGTARGYRWVCLACKREAHRRRGGVTEDGYSMFNKHTPRDRQAPCTGHRIGHDSPVSDDVVAFARAWVTGELMR